jgi:uncharacterized protein YifE (UPF0438 family)
MTMQMTAVNGFTNSFRALASKYADMPVIARSFAKMADIYDREIEKLARFRGTTQELNASNLASCIAQVETCDVVTKEGRKAKKLLERNVAMYRERLGLEAA